MNNKRKINDPFETPVPDELKHFVTVVVPSMDIENIEEKLSDLKDETQTQLRNLKINILDRRLCLLRQNSSCKSRRKLFK